MVVGNTDRVAGAAIALGAAGAFCLSAGASVAAVMDPQAVKSLFGETPKVAQVLSAVGAMVNFSYMHVLGRNLMRRNPNLFGGL